MSIFFFDELQTSYYCHEDLHEDKLQVEPGFKKRVPKIPNSGAKQDAWDGFGGWAVCVASVSTASHTFHMLHFP